MRSPRCLFSVLLACQAAPAARAPEAVSGPSAAAPTAQAAVRAKSKFPDYGALDPAVQQLEPALKDGVQAALARPELRAYRGWLKYLRFRAAHDTARSGEAAGQAARERLALWLETVTANPGALGELRGAVEWAYESPVDGSGQPFKLNIPTDYDPARPAPLSLYMHGYSGNHLEHAEDIVSHDGFFELSVLGRSRGGRYLALSEADVIHALRYVEQHWAVDADRIHLTGGSMGGGGTFWLGARYPHRFASGRPVCGFASDKPLGNLLNLPLYATHSDDDWTVSILHARTPMAWLAEHGAPAVFDPTTGLGHAAWTYAEGNARARAWAFQQRRREPSSMRRVDFTALDGTARRAFWAEVAVWGSEPRPAHFVAEWTEPNQLSLSLDNVDTLRLHLDQSPLDRSQPLVVRWRAATASAVSEAFAAELRVPVAPLSGEALDLRWVAAERPSFAAPDPAAPSPHTPGGANQLYAGEPLLIVYGTAGPQALQAALERAARAAASTSKAEWWPPSGDVGKDGIPHNSNLYGMLPVKADTEVSEAELVGRHLVLIGTAAQNRVVARLAAELPVRFDAGQIAFSDGVTVSSAGRSLGLVYRHPLAPERRIFWVASDAPEAYSAGNWAAQRLGQGLSGADAVVAENGEAPTLVTTRSFDTEWRWLPPRGPLAPREWRTQRGSAEALASALSRATGSELAVVPLWHQAPDAPAITPGITTLRDLEVMHYFEPVQVLTLNGEELARVREALASTGSPLLLHTMAPPRPGRPHTVAVPAGALWPLIQRVRLAPPARMAEATVGDALRALRAQ